MVIVIEKKQCTNQKYDFKAGLWSFAKVVKNFNLTQKLKNLSSIVNLKKLEEFIYKKEQDMSNSIDNRKQNENESSDAREIAKEITSAENLSYVDFDNKTEKFGDIFTKYIRGEIPMNEVKDKLIQGFDKNHEEPADDEIKNIEEDNHSAEVERTEGIDETDSNGSVESFIDLAFQAKTEGRFMDAIELYIQALEKRPDAQLVLWIVIDICSLYRQMGQEELAKEMMESYIESAGDTLNQQMKEEIMANFNIEI